jgi:hypothetical protein
MGPEVDCKLTIGDTDPHHTVHIRDSISIQCRALRRADIIVFPIEGNLPSCTRCRTDTLSRQLSEDPLYRPWSGFSCLINLIYGKA